MEPELYECMECGELSECPTECDHCQCDDLILYSESQICDYGV